MGIVNMILKIKCCQLVPIAVKIPRFLAWIEAKSGCKREESKFVVLQKKILQIGRLLY